MIIKVLAENTSIMEELGSEHGLSLYIETKHHKLLFDTGASGLFAENAKKMQVDLSEVDIAVISHGHYDHGGGLKDFLSVNNKAKIYLNQDAFGKHYANRPNGEKRYIGLDQSLLPNDRFIFVGEQLAIDHELELFSHVAGQTLSPSGNKDLFMAAGQSVVPDDFCHEQNLIIKEEGKTVLIAGCAHKGIINILEHFRLVKEYLPSHVIGGFHLYNRSFDQDEDALAVMELGEKLQNTDAMFYTCHCTGMNSYQRLKSIMKEQIEYISTGSCFS